VAGGSVLAAGETHQEVSDYWVLARLDQPIARQHVLLLKYWNVVSGSNNYVESKGEEMQDEIYVYVRVDPRPCLGSECIISCTPAS
jgi:hypothetical protein